MGMKVITIGAGGNGDSAMDLNDIIARLLGRHDEVPHRTELTMVEVLTNMVTSMKVDGFDIKALPTSLDGMVLQSFKSMFDTEGKTADAIRLVWDILVEDHSKMIAKLVELPLTTEDELARAIDGIEELSSHLRRMADVGSMLLVSIKLFGKNSDIGKELVKMEENFRLQFMEADNKGYKVSDDIRTTWEEGRAKLNSQAVDSIIADEQVPSVVENNNSLDLDSVLPGYSKIIEANDKILNG